MENEKERDNLMDFLYGNGIDTRRFFYPVHTMPPYKKYSRGNYTASTDIAERGINLPSSVKLKKEEVDYVCSKINEFIDSL